jgi:hypothetical protein
VSTSSIIKSQGITRAKTILGWERGATACKQEMSQSASNDQRVGKRAGHRQKRDYLCKERRTKQKHKIIGNELWKQATDCRAFISDDKRHRRKTFKEEDHHRSRPPCNFSRN